MKLIGSKRIPIEKRKYHRSGCIYEKRIKHKKSRPIEKIVHKENIGCRYCTGLLGEVRVNKKNIDNFLQKHRMGMTCDASKKRVYVWTKIGFWKIQENNTTGKYILFHKNEYEDGMDLTEAMNGWYHRQKDVSESDDLFFILRYITEHDKAKAIIKDDYRKLPQRTKKEKRYYKIAQNKHRAKEAKRLDAIFDMLEKQREAK